MEILLLVIILALIIFSHNRSGAIKKVVELQHTAISQLSAELRALKNELRQSPPTVSSIEPSVEPLAERVPVVVDIVSVIPPEPESLPEPVLMPQATVRPERVPAPLPVREPVKESAPSFFQRFLAENPDLEKFIGENLINKIGIAILVAGIGYFVKFAIDQEWINEIGRVLIGVLAGGLLLGVAHRIRQSFSAFSSVLVAGGLSVLYFTIAIAFSDYKIFSQTAAFILMVVITGFSILLAIAYNRSALAVMSLIGGFATPFMVSSGSSNYMVLLTYLLILDVGMLILAYFKKWNIVHLVAYGFTILLYGIWLKGKVIDAAQAPYAGALVFASLFYLVFMAMNLVYNLRAATKFSATEITLLLSNTAFYYAAGMTILANVDQGAYQGLFTAGLGVINLGLAAWLFRRGTVDQTLIYLLIGLVITFASLTIPVQLDGNFITMFWALEAVLLLWLAHRSGLTLLATGSVFILGLMLISLTMDWSALYLTDYVTPRPPLPIIVNQAFITSLIGIGSLLMTHRLLHKQLLPFQFWVGKLSITLYQRIINYLTIIVIYFAGIYEVNYQLTQSVGFGSNHTIGIGAYHLLFALILLLVTRRLQVPSALIQAAILSLIVLTLFVVTFDPSVHDLLLSYFQGDEKRLTGFFIHYLSLACVMGLLVVLNGIRPTLAPLPPLIGRLWPWFFGFIIVYTASSELFSHLVYLNFSGAELPALPAQKNAFANRYYDLLTQINKVGLPILWGICAFTFMYVGLTRRNRQFRILSLSLFALTLFKLFFYDLRGISEGGRIAAFISLGAILLIISFMYQRIKRLILDTDTPKSATRDA